MFLLSLVLAISTCPIKIDLDRPHILLIHHLFCYIVTVLTLNDRLCFIGRSTSARPDSTPRFDQNPTPRITIHEIREACMQLDRFHSTSDGDMACSSAGAGRPFRAAEMMLPEIVHARCLACCGIAASRGNVSAP